MRLHISAGTLANLSKAAVERLPLNQIVGFMVVAPLIFLTAFVAWKTEDSLEQNSLKLTEALEFQAKANKIYPLLLQQEQATLKILINPESLAEFSDSKIAAYDDHKKLLLELKEVKDYADLSQNIEGILEHDEKFLRPLDTRILELLFEDQAKAHALYLGDYERLRQQYETLIQSLIDNVNLHVEREKVIFEAKNRGTVFTVTLAMIAGVLLVILITWLSARIAKSGANVKTLLDILPEGMFFFDSSGHIPRDRSKALRDLLPGSESCGSIFELLSRFANAPQQKVEFVCELLWPHEKSDFYSDFDATVSLLPSSLDLSHDGQEKFIRFSYKGIYDGKGNLTRVAVIITDVTKELHDEHEVQKQEERIRQIKMAISRLEFYQMFVADTGKLASGISEQLAKPSVKINDLQRHLHTLKGNLATFQFTTLAKKIHQLESLLEEGSICEVFLQTWQATVHDWEAQTQDLEKLLGIGNEEDRILLCRKRFERFSDYINNSGDIHLVEELNKLSRRPLSELMGKYESYIDQLSNRSDEKRVKFFYAQDSSELSFQEIEHLDVVLSHIFRNCFDHGLEGVVERIAQGKAPEGSISIAGYRQFHKLVLIIEDDGRGIDTDKLARKAIEKGIWSEEKAAAASEEEKISIIFVPNLSTKDQVTEISGRGIGMDAVKSGIEALGGIIEVKSRQGIGTQFKIDIPLGNTHQKLAA